jgi:hypothetical protein
MWNEILIVKNEKIMTSSIFKYEKDYIEIISMHFIIKLFILWWLFLKFKFWYYNDIFLNPHFSFFFLQTYNVIISKVHNESILSINFNKIFTIVYCNMDNEKIENFNVWYILHFKCL